jgi:putative nucleotidyltransferase with HDIG domain
MRILFVDDEEMVLRMLRLAVASMQGQWEASFAASGPEALDSLARQPADIVVSDMRMPGMNGAQLLNEVFRLHPETFRVILTGFVEQERVMETVGTAHQFLSKPIQLDALKELFRRADSLRQRLENRQTRLLISQTGCLPTVPDIYFKILNALQEPDCPAERIADIAATDPGLTSKLLQLVNSAFFGFASPVSSPKEAVMILGTGTIRSLALTCRLFSAFKLDASSALTLDQVWNHSCRVARMAEHIARLEHSNHAIIEQAFTAGLLHDLGKLILAQAIGPDYAALVRQAQREKCVLGELEKKVLGTSHAEIGASLLQLWGLPSPLVEAVLYHEAPEDGAPDGFSALIAVHVANVLDHEAHNGSSDGAPRIVDSACLHRLNLKERFEKWRELSDDM